RFGREMAMARADVYDQGIWRGCRARKRFAEPGIHRLSNEMFDHGPVRCWRSYCHNGLDFRHESLEVNNYLANYSNIFQSLAGMTAEERKHRIEAYLQKVEFAALEDLA